MNPRMTLRSNILSVFDIEFRYKEVSGNELVISWGEIGDKTVHHERWDEGED